MLNSPNIGNLAPKAKLINFISGSYYKLLNFKNQNKNKENIVEGAFEMWT